MGRRPNPLVVEFFERGPKLSDNSNRYEHTCKRCGAVFPKGRVDGLINHLLRRCSQVTDQDRQTVFQQISAAPEQPQIVDKEASATQMPTTIQQEDLPEVSLPSYQQHEQSALDTLAEVSRRHLDYSSNAAPAKEGGETRGKTLSEVLAEQVLITELSNYDPTAQPSQTPRESHSATSNTLDASPLVQAATAASQQLELAQATQDHNEVQSDLPLDPQLTSPQESRQFLEGINDFTQHIEQMSTMTWVPRKVRKLKDPPKVPEGAPTPGFGLLHLPTIGNKRKRFDVDRRREVSDLRKQGACIRCRMLKKPCSGDDPCTTCQMVQSARLWKTKCLRTRLADEFTLWSSNLVQTKATVALSRVMQQPREAGVPVRVVASIPSSGNVGYNFAAKAHGDAASRCLGESSGLILLDDGEAASNKFEQYSKHLVTSCGENETFIFMKATIQQAQNLLEAEDNSKTADEAGLKSARSCYSLQDQLLKNVLELWALTRMLTSPSNEPWTLQFTNAEEAQRQQQDSDSQHVLQNHHTHSIPETSPSHALVVSQLLGEIELRCSKLSRTIMNELERRLLQRQQVSPFASLLSAIILLACVERMTWLFRSFDTNEPNGTGPRNKNETSQVDETTPNAREDTIEVYPPEEVHTDGDPKSTPTKPSLWPLETPPSSYWNQGQHFSELLTMLLRMRGLPPKTNVTSAGTLSSNPALNPPLRINGRPVQEDVDAQTKAAAAWLDPLKLNVAELVEKRNGLPPGEQGVEGWQMKFVAMVLLPENVG